MEQSQEDHRDLSQLAGALRVAEQRLKLALDASNICVWEYDLSTGGLDFSNELGAVLGYARGDVESHVLAWEAFVHPDDLGPLKAALVRHYRRQAPGLDIVTRMRARTGEWRWLHMAGRVVARDESGRALRMVGTHRDVTEWRKSEQELQLRDMVIDAATNAIIIVDAKAPDTPVVHVNRAFETMTGYAPADAIGRNCRFLQGDDRAQPGIERLREAIAAGEGTSVLLRNYRKDGTLFWNQLQVSPVRDDAGTVTHFVGIQSDVSALKNYQAELEYRANYDGLTGLANKILLGDRLDRAIRLAGRTGHKVGILYLDLDRLKIVNDSLGHASGDELLKSVAARLNTCVRASDTVARLGGDEFAIVLTELDGKGSAHEIARDVLAKLEMPLAIGSDEVAGSASIGVCVYPDDGTDASLLLKHADLAMYRAKHGGGNQICVYSEDLNENALERLRLESALRRALAMSELELYYQPRVDLGTNRVTSVEALLRWRRPEHGLVSPETFIPVAEETGLIVPIGEWVMSTACQQMVRWRDAGHGTLRIAVNLSARQLRQPELADRVRAVLAQTGLEARHLELEITESAAMQDAEKTRETLAQLRDLGIAVAIDDFGTGYSSLAYLKRFPIDYLKIDKSFVDGIPDDEDDYHIVRSIIALGRSLKLTIIAEGVETEKQRAHLHAHGCHEMQGFLFSSPRPAHELESILGAEWRSHAA